jgi:hypothetical protein
VQTSETPKKQKTAVTPTTKEKNGKPVLDAFWDYSQQVACLHMNSERFTHVHIAQEDEKLGTSSGVIATFDLGCETRDVKVRGIWWGVCVSAGAPNATTPMFRPVPEQKKGKRRKKNNDADDEQKSAQDRLKFAASTSIE